MQVCSCEFARASVPVRVCSCEYASGIGWRFCQKNPSQCFRDKGDQGSKAKRAKRTDLALPTAYSSQARQAKQSRRTLVQSAPLSPKTLLIGLMAQRVLGACCEVGRLATPNWVCQIFLLAFRIPSAKEKWGTSKNAHSIVSALHMFDYACFTHLQAGEVAFTAMCHGPHAVAQALPTDLVNLIKAPAPQSPLSNRTPLPSRSGVSTSWVPNRKGQKRSALLCLLVYSLAEKPFMSKCTASLAPEEKSSCANCRLQGQLEHFPGLLSQVEELAKHCWTKKCFRNVSCFVQQFTPTIHPNRTCG